MRNIGYFLVLAVWIGVVSSCCQKSQQENKYAALQENLPFEMPVVEVPEFPDYEVKLTDFGAVGDGITMNTEAFEQAMAALEQKGGGKLFVPAGVWYTGPIVFRSNVNLYLDKGAVVLFNPDVELYPLVETVFEGLDTRRCQSPVSGRNLENIAITGEGAIDGNGECWRPVKRQKVTESQWKRITGQGGVFKRPDYWMPSEKYLLGDQISNMNVPQQLKTEEEWQAVKDFLRPVMVNFIECRNVLLQGVIFQNSPAWNLHPLMCENVIIDGVTVRNPSYAQNGDGLDLESCRNVLIVNSTFDVGDDGICIKSGKDEDGRRRARPCENILVDNCTVFKGHGGFVVGSEMSGGVKNIRVTHCKFLGTDVGLRFKSRRGRGGVVENIYVENVSMTDILTEPLLFDLYYGGKSAVEVLEEGEDIQEKLKIPQADETTPAFRNIYIKGLRCSKARRAMYFNGLPEQNIDRIVVEDMVVTSELGGELAESRNIHLKDVTIHPAKGAALILKNCKEAEIENFQGGEVLRMD